MATHEALNGPEYLSQMYRLLLDHFNEEDLRTLCFEIGLEYEDLGARGRANNARELIVVAARQEIFADLLVAAQKMRPRVIWPDMPEGVDLIQSSYRLKSGLGQWKGPILAGLVVLFMALAGVSYASWLNTQPKVMGGDFNIAVAEFVETGASKYDTPIAPIIAQRLTSFLSGQYALSTFENVQVVHERIGVVADAMAAQALAEKIKADVVIFGDVTVLGEQVLVAPQIFVAESHRANVGEVGGDHAMTAPATFTVDELLDTTEGAVAEIQRKTAVLVEFTKALVYLAADDLDLGRTAADGAIRQAQAFPDFAGEEVIYLFASEIARLQRDFTGANAYLDEAFRLNDAYGRGYVARANVYYDQGELFAARQAYEQALTVVDKPFGAYLTEKANLGLGNICSVQYQHVWRSGEADETAVTELANCALTNYQRVIESYAQKTNPEMSLTGMAALAYYGSGLIYQDAGDFTAAQQAYEQVLAMTDDPELRTRTQIRLDEVKE